MSIIYSKNGGLHNGAIGKLETPIKMVIEHESDLLTKKGGIRDWLFNVEKSNRFGETIVGENEFGVFPDRRQTFFRHFGQTLASLVSEISISKPASSSHSSPDLIKLTKPKLVTVNNHQCVCIFNVNAVFNDGCAHKHISFTTIKRINNIL